MVLKTKIFKCILAFSICIQPEIFVYIKFINLRCVAYDKPFADFRQCKLKTLSRNAIALSLHVRLFQVPVNDVSVNLDVYKKANGYRAFMFNITTDFCQFLKNKKRIPFGKLLMDTVEAYSNINHTCPFDNDIIVTDMVLKPEQMQLLPVPMGEYMLRISVAAYNDYKATVKAYISLLMLADVVVTGVHYPGVASSMAFR
ncbi:PREDICTED: uncharacterized protein LOC108971868 [Bactrocera latifrons]|uniref:uncharacterized protein LOC108971868 n=1 Tax=Bactrocera latifrons TaxID=174628 RepID=UPI0008DDF6FD|nr:PREDICTED: uncharacterized protein LOC108971868 [Bactrocera latifrons]